MALLDRPLCFADPMIIITPVIFRAHLQYRSKSMKLGERSVNGI